MAENPKFNNSDMFKNIDSNDYSNITPDSTSEVLATQGNVINSIKTFWNNLRKKLAYAISRHDYGKQVGGDYVPIFVNADGVVQECQPTTVQADIANNGIITIPTKDIPNDSIYTGTTVCISVLNNLVSDVNSNLQIQHNNSKALVKYPSGVTVLAGGISKGDLLLATFCKTSTSSGNNFWILLNKINTVVSTTENGGHPGLMTAEDKAKLNTIDRNANNYSLPKASSTALGGIMLGYTTNETNETNRNYKLQTDNNGNGYVNVPWTVYSLPTASKNTLGGVKSSSNTNSDNNNKIYHVGVNTNGIMTVNVPWTDNNSHDTARITVGTQDTTQNNQTNGQELTYINIIDNENENKSHIKVKGDGGTEVSSNSSGELIISSPTVHYYTTLKTDSFSDNNGISTSYLVFGPGKNKANTNNYLAGNGTWVKGILVPVPTSNDYGKTLKCDNNGKIYWG